MAGGLIILPTRSRVALAGLWVERFAAARRADTDLLIAADADQAWAYRREMGTLPPWARLEVGPPDPECLTVKLNRYAIPAAWRYPAVGWAADDTEPEPGWDAALFAALDTPGIAVPAGTARADGIGEHQVVSSVIIRALGWYFEPSMRHYCTDLVWHELGQAAGCWRPVPGAMLRHHRVGGYEEAERNGPHDGAAYTVWRAERMAADVATVKEAIRVYAAP